MQHKLATNSWRRANKEGLWAYGEGRRNDGEARTRGEIKYADSR